MKRGQITIFMILGLIILIITGTVFFIGKQSIEQKGEARVREQQLSAALINPVQEYVTSCLEIGTQQAIETLGKQGGYIYVSQGGTTPDPIQIGEDYAQQEQFKVSYSILGPIGTAGSYKSQPPEYPYEKFPLVNEKEFFGGYYGRNRAPSIEQIQKQLEDYTLLKTIECIDLNFLAERGILVSAGQPSINLTIAENDITFNLQYPLTVTSTLGEGRASFDRFARSYPMRLKKVYTFMKRILDQDVINITFSPDGFKETGTQARVERDQFQTDDFIVITDEQSRYLGRPFEFRFARHNRRPALYYFEPPPQIFCNETMIRFDGNKLEIDNSCGDNFEITFQSIDPDEDFLIDEPKYIVTSRNFPSTFPEQDFRIKCSLASQGLMEIRTAVKDKEGLEDWQSFNISMMKSGC